MSSFNSYIFHYSYNYLLRNKAKNISIFAVLVLLVSLLASLFFLSNAIERELMLQLQNRADITLHNMVASKETFIDEDVIQKILNIEGVSDARGIIDGIYTFKKASKNFYILGIDPFETQEDTFIQKLLQDYSFDDNSMLISDFVAKVFNKAYYKEYFNFIKPDGTLKKVSIGAVFETVSQPAYKEYIVMTKESARDIFGIANHLVSYIAIDVPNKSELPFVAQKLRELFPNGYIETKNDLEQHYKTLFDFYGGNFLTLFIIVIFTFFIIIYDKLSGLSSEQRREIGILKAIGWRIEDVMKAKFYEAFFIAFFAYIIGVFIAYLFVFHLKAPLFGNIILHDTALKLFYFKLSEGVDPFVLFMLFLVTIVPYLAAVIIPAWQVATIDADEVMR
jgi:ABC-type lipoprotein release transport system permease subunit